MIRVEGIEPYRKLVITLTPNQCRWLAALLRSRAAHRTYVGAKLPNMAIQQIEQFANEPEVESP